MPKMIIPTVGVFPAPPSYNADLVCRSGALVWRQHERAQASFSAATSVNVTWPDFQTRTFEVRISHPVITDGDGFVLLDAISVTSTGCTIQASSAWSGTVNIDIAEVV